MNPLVLKALKALMATMFAHIVQLIMEFGCCIGATGLVGTAVHLPGVLQTGAAAFAALTGLRYFLIPSKAVQASAAPKEEASGLDDLYAAAARMAASQAAQKPTTTAGPYL